MIVALALKGTLAVALALVIVASLGRSRASLRHLVLATLFAFLLLLPLAQKFAPRWAIEVEAKGAAVLLQERAERTERPAAGLEAGRPAGTRRSLENVNGLTLYFTGSALMLLWLGVGVLRLQRVARRGEVWLDGTARLNAIAGAEDIRRSALVILSREITAPLTFGFRRSTVVLPFAAKRWSDEELTHALRHELEHVRRDDWMLQLAARAALTLYWLHPLAWVAWRRFCLEAERACDDAVVSSCATPDLYAGQLVALARDVRRMTGVPALAMASRSRLALRVSSILDPSQLRGRHSRATGVATLAIALALLVSIAPAQLVAAVRQTIRSEAATRYASLRAETLILAAEAGDVEEVRRLLDTGLDVNTVSRGDGTALIGAARGGQVPVIEFLLDRGADVNLEVPGDGCPLIAAAHEGHVEAVRELLDRGAEIEKVVPEDENALIQAAAEGHVDVVRLLIDRGADVDVAVVAKGREVRTAIGMAQRGGFTEIERMLLRASRNGRQR